MSKQKRGLEHIDPATGKFSMKIYELKNKEKLKNQKKEYYLKNKEKIKQQIRSNYSKNKDIILKKLKERRNTPQFKSFRKEEWRRYTYGMTPGQFDDMIKNQNNKCTICINEFNENIKFLKPHVDHDHQTGKIRSLLCGYCNFALGHVKENINILYNIINYLKEHKTDKQLERIGIKGKAREIEEMNRLSELVQKEIEAVNVEIKKSENSNHKWLKLLKEKAKRYDLMRFELRKIGNKI